MIYVSRQGHRVANEKLAYNEMAQKFYEWDPTAGEYPNLVLIAVWDRRSQDHYASDEYGRFIVPPAATTRATPGSPTSNPRETSNCKTRPGARSALQSIASPTALN